MIEFKLVLLPVHKEKRHQKVRKKSKKVPTNQTRRYLKKRWRRRKEQMKEREPQARTRGRQVHVIKTIVAIEQIETVKVVEAEVATVTEPMKIHATVGHDATHRVVDVTSEYTSRR